MPNYNVLNLVGKKFGKLTVIRFHGIGKWRRHEWECLCECGKSAILNSSALNSGTKSCGCYMVERNSLPPTVAALRKLYYTYKHGAKRRGLAFELDEAEFKRLTSLNCFYCESAPYSVVKSGKIKFNGDYIYNGIDRVDNSVGYIEGNCVPCCTKCNLAKRGMSFSEFKEWATRLNEGLTVRGIRMALGGTSPDYASYR